jgi:hypothetical protein
LPAGCSRLFHFGRLHRFALLAGMGALGSSGGAARVPPSTQAFIEAHCASCHDDVEKKGGLDLTALGLRPEDPKNFAAWVKVHDRVRAGEMPPRKKARPAAGEIESFVTTLAGPLRAAEEAAEAGQGRATQRRLNRHEYENAVRDLLGAPWLQIRDGLPEDGEAHRFNKIGDAIDLSHVNLARYLAVADEALRQVLAHQVERPETKVTRCFAREQRSFSGRMIYSVFNTRAERATFPVLGTQAQPDVRSTTQPITVAAADPATRELEAMGVVASSYEPIELRFERFKAPQSGRYKVRVSAYSVWVGPGKADRWWIPNFDDESPGRRPEPLTFMRRCRRGSCADWGPTMSAPNPPRASSMFSCSKAKPSGPTPCVSSARDRRIGSTRSRPVRASPASRSAGLKWRGRCSRAGRAPATA